MAGSGLRRGAGRQDGGTPLHRAAESGSEEGVRALVEWKADVNARDQVQSGRRCDLGFASKWTDWSGMEGNGVQDVPEGGSGCSLG